MGSEVTLFFTFWGLNLLRKGERVKVKKSLIESMFGMMMPRGSKRTSLSKMNMGGMGTMMMYQGTGMTNLLMDLIKTTDGMNIFMSDDLSNGQSFNYTFNQTGTFYYYDMNHMNNKTLIGTIVVQ